MRGLLPTPYILRPLPPLPRTPPPTTARASLSSSPSTQRPPRSASSDEESDACLLVLFTKKFGIGAFQKVVRPVVNQPWVLFERRNSFSRCHWTRKTMCTTRRLRSIRPMRTTRSSSPWGISPHSSESLPTLLRCVFLVVRIGRWLTLTLGYRSRSRSV